MLRLSGGRRLQSPPGDRARPTAARVRQAVMNMLAPQIRGSRWLDLCSGSGVMACEALQRGASQVEAIEQDRRIARVAAANLEAVTVGLGQQCGRWRVSTQEAVRWLHSSQAQAFDLIYCDPPYAAGLYGPLAAAIAARDWLQPDGLLIWECSTAALPEVPVPWTLVQQRRYGSTSLLVLSCRAGCRGDTGSTQP